MWEQAGVFFLLIVWGSVVGFIFDCLRTLQRFWRYKSWVTSIGDFLFWFLVTIFTYFLLVLITWGEVRFFVFGGMALGLCLYLKFCSNVMRRILSRIFRSSPNPPKDVP